MVLASSPDKHGDKSRETWHSIAYVNEDLDASELQSDWPDGLPRLFTQLPRETV
jgi:hypothetical protein